MAEPNARVVYSTGTGRVCTGCGAPQQTCRCHEAAQDSPVPRRLVATLRMEKKGRGGKTVTVVDGLPDNLVFRRDLCQALKRACATGGAVVEGGVELQGDLRERVRGVLTAKGFTVKG